MIVQAKKKELKKRKITRPGPFSQLKIWVLYPYLETEDPNLKYYYDFSQSLEEYSRVFGELNADWTWKAVTLQNYKELIAGIKKASGIKIPLVLNLCDGDEVNGTPGISVIRELEERKLIYTGADTDFFDITTSKIPMKERFEQCAVPTPRWAVVSGKPEDSAAICDSFQMPVLIKPAVSGGSMGVSVKNLVSNVDEFIQRVAEMENGYRGWNLMSDGLIVEEFIEGPEYTTLIVGSYDRPESLQVFAPVERIFHKSLPARERFLSFDRLWEIYEEEEAMPSNANFYEYGLPSDPELTNELISLTRDAYIAVGGKGYGRLDIRRDTRTGKLFVLEVNAQCGLSEDENFTSIGAILRFSKIAFSELITDIIRESFHRRNIKL